MASPTLLAPSTFRLTAWQNVSPPSSLSPPWCPSSSSSSSSCTKAGTYLLSRGGGFAVAPPLEPSDSSTVSLLTFGYTPSLTRLQLNFLHEESRNSFAFSVSDKERSNRLKNSHFCSAAFPSAACHQASIAAAKAANCPVVAAATAWPAVLSSQKSAVAETVLAPFAAAYHERGTLSRSNAFLFPVVVGLENGQVWLYQWRQVPQIDTGATAADAAAKRGDQLDSRGPQDGQKREPAAGTPKLTGEARRSSIEDTTASVRKKNGTSENKTATPACSAQHLISCRMAQPLRICVRRYRSPVEGETGTDMAAESDKYGDLSESDAEEDFEVYVLYSDGAVIGWQRRTRRRVELPPVAGAVGMNVDAECRFIAVSCSTRRLVVYARQDVDLPRSAAAANCSEKQQQQHREHVKQQQQFAAADLRFSMCFNEEIFRKVLFSDAARGLCLQTAWHPYKARLFLPGAPSVRTLDLPSGEIQELVFASTKDPLLVFDKVEVLPLSSHSPGELPASKDDKQDMLLLLASVGPEIKAWNAGRQQLLFTVHAADLSGGAPEGALLQLTAWPALLKENKQQTKQEQQEEQQQQASDAKDEQRKGGRTWGVEVGVLSAAGSLGVIRYCCSGTAAEDPQQQDKGTAVAAANDNTTEQQSKRVAPSLQEAAAASAHKFSIESGSTASVLQATASAAAASNGDEEKEIASLGGVAEAPAAALPAPAPQKAPAASRPSARAAEERGGERGKTEAEEKAEDEEGDAGIAEVAAGRRLQQTTSSLRKGTKRSRSRSSEEEQDEEQQGTAEAEVRRFVSLQAEEVSESSSEAESNKLFGGEEEEASESLRREQKFSASSRSSSSSSSSSGRSSGSDTSRTSSKRRKRRRRRRDKGRSGREEDCAAATNDYKRHSKKVSKAGRAESLATSSGKAAATADGEALHGSTNKETALKSEAAAAKEKGGRALEAAGAAYAAEASDPSFSSSISSASEADGKVKKPAGFSPAADTPSAAAAVAGNKDVEAAVALAAAKHVDAASAAAQKLSELLASFTRFAAALPTSLQNGSAAAAKEGAGATGGGATATVAVAAAAAKADSDKAVDAAEIVAGETGKAAISAARAGTDAACAAKKTSEAAAESLQDRAASVRLLGEGNFFETLQQTVAAVQKGMLALVQEQRTQQQLCEMQQQQQEQHRREERDRLHRLKKENSKLRRGMRELIKEIQQQQEKQQQEQQRQRKLLQHLERRGNWGVVAAPPKMKLRHAARALMPGACKQPADAAVPWCLFWNQHGHVAKMQQNEKITLEVFCFSAAAALAGVSRRRLIDYGDACMAALSKIGVALACGGDPRRAIPSRVEFRSLIDSCQWSKTLPGKERAVGVAVGDSFVAAVSSSSLLYVFTPGGVALSLTRLPGYPVGLCGHHQLLLVLTAASPAIHSSEGEAAAAANRRRQSLRGRSSCSDSLSSDDTGRERSSSAGAAAAGAAATAHSNNSSIIYTCMLLHVHPPPAAPAAAFRFPFGCRDRLQKTPPAMAKVFPHVDVLHEGPLVLESPVDWVHISNEGMPAVKDASGTVWGLLPMWGTPGESAYVPYRFSWVPLLNLRDAAAVFSSSVDEEGDTAAGGPGAAAAVKYWPVYIDDMRSELVAVRLSSGLRRKGLPAAAAGEHSGGGAGAGEQSHSLNSCSDSASDVENRRTSAHSRSGKSSSSHGHRSSRAATRGPLPEEPDCSTSAPLFGHRLEQLPLRLPFPDVWEYSRWRAAVRQDRRLQPVAAAAGAALEAAEAGSSGESSSRSGQDGFSAVAAVPWQQYDEIRLRTDSVIRLLCVGLKNWGGGAAAGGGMGTPEQQQQQLLKEEQIQEAKEAEKKLKLLCKTHDKFAVREFVAMKEDRRLHLAALDVMLRFKLPQVAAGVRTQLEGDCRMQTAKLLESIQWQQEEAAADPLALGQPVSPAACSASVRSSAAAAVASLPCPRAASASAAEEGELAEETRKPHPSGERRRRFPPAFAEVPAAAGAVPSLWKDVAAAAVGRGGEKDQSAGRNASSRSRFSNFLRGNA